MSVNQTEGNGDTIKFTYVYMTFSAATLAECLLAGYVTFLNRDLRRKLSFWFSSSLMVSIGIFSSLSFVYAIVLVSTPILLDNVPANCQVKLVQRYLSAVCCLNITCLALDRYVAICWPLRYNNILTEARCRQLCIACWVSPIVCLMLPCVNILTTMCSKKGKDLNFLVAYSVVYSIGALATFIFYILVALEFRHEFRGQPHDENKATTEALVRRKTAKSALQVFMLYTVLSVPHTLIPLFSRILPVAKWMVLGSHLVHRLHLLLFLPMYSLASISFFASLKALGLHLWRKVTCATDSLQQMSPTEMSFAHDSTVGGL
ncbi:olfactory receptor 6C6 [Cherax quadricarinatus]|uniref:olfactory receptor 6C6 n=1 Tax=Cherax quadricarinatus TaxID=27406 RepID=UPI0023783660|nr:olfactory receptor 6C6-like [Cherax quadricarinatus]